MTYYVKLIECPLLAPKLNRMFLCRYASQETGKPEENTQKTSKKPCHQNTRGRCIYRHALFLRISVEKLHPGSEGKIHQVSGFWHLHPDGFQHLRNRRFTSPGTYRMGCCPTDARRTCQTRLCVHQGNRRDPIERSPFRQKLAKRQAERNPSRSLPLLSAG